MYSIADNIRPSERSQAHTREYCEHMDRLRPGWKIWSAQLTLIWRLFGFSAASPVNASSKIDFRESEGKHIRIIRNTAALTQCNGPEKEWQGEWLDRAVESSKRPAVRTCQWRRSNLQIANSSAANIEVCSVFKYRPWKDQNLWRMVSSLQVSRNVLCACYLAGVLLKSIAYIEV